MSPVRALPPTGPKFRRSAFTLIEVLVVIFLIGLLIAATLTIIPKVKIAVYGAQTQSQLSALANAIQQYYNDYKSYPGPLGNNQLYYKGDSVSTLVNGVNINEPNAYGNLLQGIAPSNFPAANQPSTGNTFGLNISGAQNLMLGLCGGLELQNGAVGGFFYNPGDLFTPQTNGAGVITLIPNPKGPASLNAATPRRQQSYISIKPGDVSIPANNYGPGGSSSASFQDSASRVPDDAMIPVFLDKYGDPLPILYYRNNVTGTAIVGFRNLDAPNGGTLTDPNLSNVSQTLPIEVAQFDLWQNYGYVSSMIGLNAQYSKFSLHGLIGLGTTANLSDTIDVNNSGIFTPSNKGANAIAYFKDPALNPPYDASLSPPNSNTHNGVARQKDGFLLISAGPDRQYGTHDDQVFPGPLLP